MTQFLQNVQYIKSKKSKFFVGWTDMILSNPILVTPWYVLKCGIIGMFTFWGHGLWGGLAPSLAAPWYQQVLALFYSDVLLVQSTEFSTPFWYENCFLIKNFLKIKNRAGSFYTFYSNLTHLHYRRSQNYRSTSLHKYVVNFFQRQF